MRLVDRLRRRSRGSATQAVASGPTAVHAGELVEVVGESYRQDALRRLAGQATDGVPFMNDLSGRPRRIAEAEDRLWFRASLVREPENEHDRNAIAVYADGIGQLGYLGRNDALAYQPVFAVLEAHGSRGATCPAFLVGGERAKPSFGVILCLSSPEQIIRELDVPVPRS